MVRFFLVNLSGVYGRAVATELIYPTLTSEVCTLIQGHHVGKLLVAYQWSAVSSTDPSPSESAGLLCM